MASRSPLIRSQKCVSSYQKIDKVMCVEHINEKLLEEWGHLIGASCYVHHPLGLKKFLLHEEEMRRTMGHV